MEEKYRVASWLYDWAKWGTLGLSFLEASLQTMGALGTQGARNLLNPIQMSSQALYTLSNNGLSVLRIQ